MPRWSAYISGDGHLLRDLPQLLDDSSFTCTAEGNGYRIFSPDFERLASAREVYEVVTRKLSGVVAATQIFGGLVGNLRCQNVRSHDGQGRRIRDTAFVTRDIYVISPAQLDEAKSTHAGIPLAGAVAALAERDDLVAHALGIVNTSQFGWPQIYDIIELLTLDLIVQRRWATRAEIRDARQTANAHRHSGSQKSYPLPEHPPSLHEARRLLWSVLGKWIRERLQADPSSD